MAKKGDSCSVCLVPFTRNNETGICTRNPECRRAHKSAYNASHKEENAAGKSAWYEANKEEAAIYYAAWYEAHKTERRDAVAAWKRDNPEGANAQNARRRVKIKINMTAEDRDLSVEYRKAIAHDPCFYCGKPGEHDDHYISLANGGTDHWWNLVRACAWCNHSKHTMNGDEFIVSTQDGSSYRVKMS